MGQLQRFAVVVTIIAVACAPWPALAQLSPGYYDGTCDNLEEVAKQAFLNAMASDQRIGASLLRMHFHDCFAQGCDGSVLLAPTPTSAGEQGADANLFLRGFDVVDAIKAAVEAACPGIVSCADILALAARDAVVEYGGPSWSVEYGRRDSLSGCLSCTEDIPGPADDASELMIAFAKKDLFLVDLVALSGSHTVGKSHCLSFKNRLNSQDPTMDPAFRIVLDLKCSSGSDPDSNLVNLDFKTPFVFDNAYYGNLASEFGLLNSDQLLNIGTLTDEIVRQYETNNSAFFGQYPASIIKMGRIEPLTGSAGEIRKVCSKANSFSEI